MKLIIIAALSYLVGCFSSAYFIGKVFKRIDIRSHGSGNVGSTNAVRVMGKKLGVLTFLLDFSKGILAVLIGYWLLGYNGGLVAGVFVVLGHDWPVFIGFRGGKGVATTLSALVILNFPTALISIIIGVIVAIISKYVSLGSIVFLSLIPIISSIITESFNIQLFITTIILSLIGIYRHKENIKRLINGTENKIW
jgi:glycerol-3-phosphate acyltransferase PlsY